jgi:hypothetical protein
VEFLTDEQAAAFGRFTGVPSQADLDRFSSWTTPTWTGSPSAAAPATALASASK